MEVKERIIDLKQFFLYLWENVIAILIIAAIFGCIFMGYSYKSQKKDIAGGGTTIHTIIKANHDAYFSLNTAKYTDAVIPDGVYNSYARVYVDFNFDKIEGSDEKDFSQLMNKLAKDVYLIVVSDETMEEIINELNLRSYPDMANITARDLSFMINKNLEGVHIVNIIVSDVNPERAELIENAVVNKFVQKAGDYLGIDEIRVMDNASKPSGSAAAARRVSRKTMVKFGILGGFAGIIVVALILLVVFLAKDSVRTEMDLMFAGTRGFGAIPRKNREEAYKKVAYSIMMDDSVNKVVVAAADKKTDTSELAEKLAAALKDAKSDKQVIQAENVEKSADALSKLMNADSIILVTSYGKTGMKKLLDARRTVQPAGDKLLGVIMTGVRYI